MTKISNKTEQVFNKLIGRNGNEYVFLEAIFHYEDGFKGATGYTIIPVTRDYYEDEDAIREWYSELWEDDVANSNTDLGLVEWISENVYDTDERFDQSFIYTDDVEYQLREQVPDVENYPIFECIGCGRMFTDEIVFDEVFDADLINKIIEVETKAVNNG